MSHAVAPAVSGAGLVAGHAVIARIRRLLSVALIAGVAYATFTVASHGGCAGGIAGSGGFVDAAGHPTDAAPMCVQLTLKPSPLMYIAIAAIVLLAIGRVLKAAHESTAVRTLDRAAAGIGVLTVVAIVVSQAWFQQIPLHELTSGSWSVLSPFPFGFIDVTTEPMAGVAG